MGIKTRILPSVIEKLAISSYTENPIDNAMFPPSPYYRFLKNICRYYKPDLSVELGVCGGGGSYHMCIGYDKGLVVGVDIAQEYPLNLRFIHETCDNYEFMLGDSTESLHRIHRRYGKIDFVFIDTTHHYNDTVKEFDAALQVINRPGIICLDDLNREDMTRFWKEINLPKVQSDFLHEKTPGGGGFGTVIIE